MDAVHAAMSSIDGQLRTGEFTPIDIRVEPAGATISIAGFASDEAFVGGRVVWLPFGTHAISAAQSGYRPATVEITTTSHAAATANIVLEKQPEITVALPPPPPPPPPPLPHVELAVHVSKVPPIVASAVTLGAMVVAAIAIDLGRQRADLSQYAISTEVYAQDHDVVKRWNTVFAISGAAAIVGAGLGGFLWYRALRDATHLEVGASATAGGASIGVGARF